MSRTLSVCLLSSCLALISCSEAQKSAQPTSDIDTSAQANGAGSSAQSIAEASLRDQSGTPIGTVSITEKAERLSINVSIDGLGPAEHAFHMHTTGTCDAPDFKSAGGHLNPFEKAHGDLNADGAHLGDLPNLVFDESRSINTVIELEGAASELLPAIFDEDGTAVMLHAGPDDYVSDPAGAAGPRIACGVLARSQ